MYVFGRDLELGFMSRKTLYLQVVMQIRMRWSAFWRCCRKAVMQGMSALQQHSQNGAHRMLIDSRCKYSTLFIRLLSYYIIKLTVQYITYWSEPAEKQSAAQQAKKFIKFAPWLLGAYMPDSVCWADVAQHCLPTCACCARWGDSSGLPPQEAPIMIVENR